MVITGTWRCISQSEVTTYRALGPSLHVPSSVQLVKGVAAPRDKMSGLEVVGLVSDIVAAFASGASYFQDRKERKKWKAEKAKDKKQELERLHLTVTSAPSQIEDEYKLFSERIGPRFAVGDGESMSLHHDSPKLTKSSDSQRTTEQHLTIDIHAQAAASGGFFSYLGGLLSPSRALRALNSWVDLGFGKSVSTASYCRTYHSQSLVPEPQTVILDVLRATVSTLYFR